VQILHKESTRRAHEYFREIFKYGVFSDFRGVKAQEEERRVLGGNNKYFEEQRDLNPLNSKLFQSRRRSSASVHRRPVQGVHRANTWKVLKIFQERQSAKCAEEGNLSSSNFQRSESVC
jgi:hypothetical protein